MTVFRIYGRTYRQALYLIVAAVATFTLSVALLIVDYDSRYRRYHEQRHAMSMDGDKILVRGTARISSCHIRAGVSPSNREDSALIGVAYRRLGDARKSTLFVANGILVHRRWFLTLDVEGGREESRDAPPPRGAFFVILPGLHFAVVDAIRVERDGEFALMLLGRDVFRKSPPLRRSVVIRKRNADAVGEWEAGAFDNEEMLVSFPDARTLRVAQRDEGATFIAYSFDARTTTMATLPVYNDDDDDEDDDDAISVTNEMYRPVFKTVSFDEPCGAGKRDCALNIGPDCFVMCRENMGAPIVTNGRVTEVRGSLVTSYRVHGLLRTDWNVTRVAQRRVAESTIPTDCLTRESLSTSNVYKRIDGEWVKRTVVAPSTE